MTIGHKSTAAQYKQYTPLRVKTGDELDKYFVDQAAARQAAAADRDRRKKAADSIAKMAKLDLPDSKHKWQQAIGDLHAKLSVESVKNLQERHRLHEAGLNGTPEYQATFAKDSQLHSELPKWKNAFKVAEDAYNRLAEGIESGEFSSTRNIESLKKLAGLYTGDAFRIKDGKLVTTDDEGKEHGWTATEIQSNPDFFEKPKKYVDFQKWIDDTADNVGSKKGTWENETTGRIWSQEKVKDVNTFREMLREEIANNPDLLEEYQAATNGPETTNENLATADNLIDDVVEKSKFFANESTSERFETKTDDKDYVKNNMVPVSSSNTLIWDKDGNEIQGTNPTYHSVDLTGTVKGAVSAVVSTAMLSGKDAQEIEITLPDGKAKKFPARERIEYNQTVENFVANIIEEEDVYEGPPVFIRVMNEGVSIPEDFEGTPAEYFHSTSGYQATRMLTNWGVLSDSQRDKETYGTYLKPGMYVPRDLIDKVNSGQGAVYSTDNEGTATRTTIPSEDVSSNTVRTAIIKGIAGSGSSNIPMDVPITAANSGFTQIINGEAKGNIYKTLDAMGRDYNGNLISTPNEEYKEEVKEDVIEGTGNAGKTTEEIKKEETGTVNIIDPKSGKVYAIPKAQVAAVLAQNPTLKKQ